MSEIATNPTEEDSYRTTSVWSAPDCIVIFTVSNPYVLRDRCSAALAVVVTINKSIPVEQPLGMGSDPSFHSSYWFRPQSCRHYYKAQPDRHLPFV